MEYVIEAPHQSIVLARGKGRAGLQLADAGVPPTIEQRQWGLLSGLIFLDEDLFAARAYAPMHDVAIVTGYYAAEAAYGFVTGIGHPWRVRVYDRVR